MSDDPGTIAFKVAKEIRLLDTGGVARLRRMPDDGAAPEFWRLHALCGVPDRNDWIAVTRILSILTDRGKPEDRTALHSDDIRWGRALCDGGDRFWEPSPQDRKPNLLSEIRLVQLLAARGEMRRVLMTRAARALSAKHGPGVQVNVKDIAWSLLNPGKTETIAKPYYNRLDGVSREHTTENVE